MNKYMPDIDAFTRAYITCSLWASYDNSNEQGGEPLDWNYSIDDIASETMQKIIADCKKFQSENAEDIATIPHRHTSDGDWNGEEQAGHDFFLARNRHGVGFWDRDFLDKEVAERLTKASHKFGETWLYVGDDNLIYCE